MTMSAGRAKRRCKTRSDHKNDEALLQAARGRDYTRYTDLIYVQSWLTAIDHMYASVGAAVLSSRWCADYMLDTGKS